MEFDLRAVMLRPGTMDESIFDRVLLWNEYRLPGTLTPGDLIIDVGAHIGCFALAAGRRGSRRILAIEAHRANFGLALLNLRPALKHGSVRLMFGAVWRSDANDDVLRCEPFPLMSGLINTGGASVMPRDSEGEEVPKFALDHLILNETHGGRTRVRLLKLDCEGSEWPILLTSSRLDLVDEIVGEFHEFGGRHDSVQPPYHIDGYAEFTSDVLSEVLARAGFRVEILRNDDNRHMGLFFARR